VVKLGVVLCWGGGMVGAKTMTKHSPRVGGGWGLRWYFKAGLILLAPGVLSHFDTFRESMQLSEDYWDLRIQRGGLISTVLSRDLVPIIGFS